MFRIDNSNTFRHPVEYTQPTSDGKRVTHTFTGEFKRVNETYISGMDANTVEEVVKDVFVGFADVQNPDGSIMESTAENIGKLLQLAGMSQALFTAFLFAIRQGKEKN